MNCEERCSRAFWWHVVAGFVLGCAVAFTVAPACAQGLDLRLPKCESHWAGLISVSRHVSPARKYNEEHWGPYYRCQFSDRWGVQVGWYENSYERSTWYALLTYTPWRVRTWVDDADLRLGGAAGFGTGYAKDALGEPKGGLSPLMGALAVVEVKREVNVGVFANTAVVAAIMDARF